MTTTEGSVVFPAPTGRYAVGVTDGEVLDKTYPSRIASDADGRRVMFRAWYPAAAPSGHNRRYFEGAELKGIGYALSKAFTELGAEISTSQLDVLGAADTHSSVDAPPATGERFPLVVYSHGAGSYATQQTVLSEELASHGYVVITASHPGDSVGVVYPDGSVVNHDGALMNAMTSLATEHMETSMKKLDPDVGERYAATKVLSGEDIAMGQFVTRWADDMRAVVDAIYAGALTEHAAELLPVINTRKLAYSGMSYGGAAATAAAQTDERATCVLNLDGGEWGPTLLDTEIRVPLLVIASDTRVMAARAGREDMAYYNEFHYERLRSMGSRSDIVRVMVPAVVHTEITDWIFQPEAIREEWRKFGLAGSCDVATVTSAINHLSVAFLDHTLKGASNNWPTAQLESHPELSAVDVTYIAEWAKSNADSGAAVNS